MMKNKLLFLIVSMTLLFTACKKFENIKGVDSDNWDPDLALALVNTDMTVQDVLNDFETGGYVQVDNTTGFVTLVYEGRVVSVSGEEISTIPDFSIPVVDSAIVAQFEFPAGDVIQEAHYKAGQITYELTSPVADPVNVTLEFVGATNASGQPLTETITLNSTNTLTGTISLANTIFDFQNNNNEFPFRYTAIRQSNGDRILLSNANLHFQGVQYQYLQGYVGPYAFNPPEDTVILDLFKNWQQGELYLEEPKVQFIINNSFGFPIRLTANKLDADTYRGGVIGLNSAQLSSGVNLAYPSLSEVGETKTTTITIDNTSNLPQIIQDVPHAVHYDLSAMANPDSIPNSNLHFTDTSKFSVDVNVELPMYGWARGFVLEDTFNLDLAIYEEFEKVGFKLITENGFPAEAKIQLYFMDNFGNTVDSLIHEPTPVVLAAAPVDGSGKVTQREERIIESYFPADRYLDLLQNAKKIRIRASIETTDAGTQSVRFYSDYGLGIKLGARGMLNVETL